MAADADVILKAEGLVKTYNSDPVFSGLNMNIQRGARIGLIGVNGAGKSTLLKVLGGEDEADAGLVQRSRNVRALYVEQDPQWQGKQVYEVLFMGSDPRAMASRKYMQASGMTGDDVDMDAFSEATDLMERVDAWDYQDEGLSIAASLNIGGDFMGRPVNSLSGGQKKRCALASALLQDPDILLLDEPTNHLDMDALEFLGDYLKPSGKKKDLTMVLVTHDRFFLEKTCDKIFELDRARLEEYPCSYNKYLELKAERLAAEDADADRARTKLRKEREWMSRQPQARQAKSKARQQQYYKLEERAVGRGIKGVLDLAKDGQARLGNNVINVRGASYSINGNSLLTDFTYGLDKGERVGIVGPNGVGKSTFLRLLTGQATCDSGEVEIGETVRVGFYEQTGLSLDERQEKMSMLKFVQEAVEQSAPQKQVEALRLQMTSTQSGRRDRNKDDKVSITLDNAPTSSGAAVSEQDARNLLQRFQFPTKRWFDRVGALSGGERRRLQLLQILAKRPNVLIFDEPSNDLDLATLASLEDYLTDTFDGSLVVVSHDEFFMNKVTDHLLVFQGKGEVGDFQGSYSDFLVYRKETAAAAAEGARATRAAAAAADASGIVPTGTSTKPKLSHSDRKECNKLEGQIVKLKNRIVEIDAALTAGDAKGYSVLAELAADADAARASLAEKEERWMALAVMA